MSSSVQPNAPARQAIATFDNYADAERAVDYLADQQFPINRLAIVGRDVELVERVTGQLNYGVAALRGAASGGLVGALIGWIFGLFSWIQPLIAELMLAFYGLVFGAAVGALVGMLVYAMQRGQRDFTTVTSLQPRHYDIVVDVGMASRALQLLQKSNQPPSNESGTAAEGTSTWPPQ
ncbi:general stress protein [Mycobacterium sp. M23085]|uniref:general stress protein n=1 Tax=Mycobacterium sp. M23085 TaxID=3378087 RepID=UPI003877ABAB